MDGVVLLVVGMIILFAAMALLIVAMVVLERVFRIRRSTPDKQEPAETETVSKLAIDTEDEEIVASIAVALTKARSLDITRSRLGTTLGVGRGLWWAMRPIQEKGRRLR
jgi:sodium pump decarboxylase gamma subunit